METNHTRAALNHATRVHSEALTEHLRAIEGSDSGAILARDLRAARADVLTDLELCDCLGFNTAHEALSAILTHDDWTTRWDCRELTVLIEDVERYKALRLAARLAGVAQ